MKNDIIPFGKYKGQSVEVIAETDAKYLEWLQLQAFVGTKFPQLLKAISEVGTGGAETPEHNALQALFLEDNFCKAFTRLFYKTVADRPWEWQKLNREIEADNGSDVRLETEFKFPTTREEWEAREAKRKREYAQPVSLEEDRHWNSKTFFIEIKPLLGDDYPAVLRQLRLQEKRTRHVSWSTMVLVVGQFESAAIDFRQLQQVFAPYAVVLVQEIKDEVNRMATSD